MQVNPADSNLVLTASNDHTARISDMRCLSNSLASSSDGGSSGAAASPNGAHLYLPSAMRMPRGHTVHYRQAWQCCWIMLLTYSPRAPEVPVRALVQLHVHCGLCQTCGRLVADIPSVHAAADDDPAQLACMDHTKRHAQDTQI